MKLLQKLTGFIPLAYLLLFCFPSFAQDDLTADGNVHKINYQGKQYLDLKIPSNLDPTISYNQITFVLKGADGGRRRVTNICTEAGGEGAKVTATFELGTSGDVLRPGSTVRFIVGQQGASERSGEADGAGGGGGTGLLYKIPEVSGNGACKDYITDGDGVQAYSTASPHWSDRTTCWVILAVAGAGGGAYAPGGCAQDGTGKGGNNGENGTSGKGLSGGSGGTDGSAGQNAWGGGGGGHKLKYWVNDSHHGEGGGLFGGNGALNRNERSAGGWGYGGGGLGIKFAGAGGGGGGYSGGGGGDLYEAGGGGGSFVQSIAASSEKKAGGNDKTPNNGFITYQFSTNTDLVDAPVAKCKEDITVAVSAGEYARITPELVNDESYDPNDRPITLKICNVCEDNDTQCEIVCANSYGYGCSFIGENITLQLKVSNGIKESSCVFTVEIEEGDAAPITCPENITVEVDPESCTKFLSGNLALNELGTCFGMLSNQIETPSGNPANPYIRRGNVISNDFELGTTTITYTVTRESDDASNSCSFTVSVIDPNTPSLSCPPNITMDLPRDECSVTISEGLEATWSGNCTAEIGYNFLNPDNDGLDILYLDGVLSSHIFSGGTKTIQYRVKDDNGFNQTCTFTVSLTDTEEPEARCQNVTIQLDEDNSDLADRVDRGSSDNCDIVSKTLSRTDFDCNLVGARRSVTLTVTDAQGLEDQCSAFIFIRDHIGPAARCKNIEVSLGNDGTATLTADQIDDGSADACGIASRSLSRTDLSCADAGTTIPVILYLTDNNENTSQCTAQVSVNDSEAPDAVCKDISIELTSSESASISAGDIDNGSSDNCTITGRSIDISSFGCGDVGDHTVTLTVSDAYQSSSCTATVSVVDKTTPILKCQDVTVYLDENGVAEVREISFVSSASDACGTLKEMKGAFLVRCSYVGQEIMHTVTVSDIYGNSSSCTQKLIVLDEITPTATGKDITLALDENGQASISPEQVDDGSSDNCDFMLSVDKSTFDCSDLGETSVELRAEDKSGRSSSDVVTITVVDNIKPKAFCKDQTISLNNLGQASVTVSMIDNGSTDNCTIKERSLNQTSFDCSDLGGNTIQLTVKDKSGNTATCTATITVSDPIAPSISCQDITVELNESGTAFISTSAIVASKSDNCTFASENSDILNYDCSDAGKSYTISHTVSDKTGNSQSCSAKVTIIDLVKPKAKCKNVEVSVNEQGFAMITAEDVDNGSADACGIRGLSLDQTTFSCNGDNSVTLIVTDNNGNVSSCNATVIMEDNVDPVPDEEVLPTIEMECSSSLTAPTATDNCAGIITGITDDPLTYSEQGTYTINWSFDDGNGNVVSQPQTVVIMDISRPIPDLAELPAVTGECSVTITQKPTATDNCGGVIIGTTNDPLTYSEQGNHPITWIFDDGNGNVKTQTQTVTISDVSKPVPDVANLPTITGECSATVTDVPTATDECEGIITGTTNDPMTYSEQGTHTITWFFDDGNGNVETQTQTVIVDDVTPPVPDQYEGLRYYLPAVEGECEATVEAVPTATDNCEGKITGTTTDPLYYDQQGTYLIRWTYDDGNGNQFVQFQKVIVRDQTAPTALCKNTTIQLGEDGQAKLLPSMIDNGSFDECSAVSLKVGLASPDLSEESQPLSETTIYCSMQGDLDVYLLVSDDSGNRSKCTAIVTVEATGSCDGDGGGSSTPWPPFPGTAPDWTNWLKSDPVDKPIQAVGLEAYPNPFSNQLNIQIYLPELNKTNIEIFNLRGQQVKTLNSDIISAGEYQLHWNGTDNNGNALPSGLYLIRMVSGDEVRTKKVLLQR